MTHDDLSALELTLLEAFSKANQGAGLPRADRFTVTKRSQRGRLVCDLKFGEDLRASVFRDSSFFDLATGHTTIGGALANRYMLGRDGLRRRRL